MPVLDPVVVVRYVNTVAEIYILDFLCSKKLYLKLTPNIDVYTQQHSRFCLVVRLGVFVYLCNGWSSAPETSAQDQMSGEKPFLQLDPSGYD